jgi:hypothetical protein
MAELVEEGAHELCFEVHGVRAVVSASDPNLLAAAVALLPAESTRCERDSASGRFALLREEGDTYRVVSPHETDQTCRDRELALSLLEAEFHLHVATHAPNRIFIHAGVAVHRHRAIVIPGASLSGKTSLVAALVRAGALYFSDEFAFLDEDGLVYPFPQPLSIRGDGISDTKWPVERLGGRKGTEPVPIGVIAITSYRPGAEWKPRQRSRGQGMLALLSHTLPARDRPADALAVTRRAVETAVVLEGERGEAELVAPALLEAVDGHVSKV